MSTDTDVLPPWVSPALAHLRSEARLLLALSQLDPDTETLAWCRQLLAEQGPTLDWGFFVDQAARHKVLPIVAKHIIDHRLDRVHGQPNPVPYGWLYTYVYEANRARNQALAVEFGAVLRAMSEAGVRYAVRKGPVVLERLFVDPGLRRMSDLDLLVERHDAAAAGEVLVEMGFSQGQIAPEGDALQGFSRRTQLFWRANVSNELPYLKVTNDLPFVGHLDVDICLDIFQKLSESAVDVGELLERRVELPLCGEPVAYALSPADQFIDLCAHLHKEAASLFYVARGSDIEILKFLDIALSCQELTAEGGWPAVRARADEYNAARSVYYALHHTALLYPRAVPVAQLDHYRPDDCGFIDEYATFDGKAERWDRTFVDRVFDPSRTALVKGTSAVPLT
jgi:hypothetical protein